MFYKLLVIIGSVLIAFMSSFAHCSGSDLDDGIPIEDDSISDYDSIKKEINIRFIKRNAKSKAMNGNHETVTGNGDVVVGGAIIGVGSEVRGDIIVIYEGDDDTLIVDK